MRRWMGLAKSQRRRPAARLRAARVGYRGRWYFSKKASEMPAA
jgi:hypothetical protein